MRQSRETAQQEEVNSEKWTDPGHPGHASNQQHFIDVCGSNTGILHAISARLLCAVQQVTHQALKPTQHDGTCLTHKLTNSVCMKHVGMCSHNKLDNQGMAWRDSHQGVKTTWHGCISFMHELCKECQVTEETRHDT